MMRNAILGFFRASAKAVAGWFDARDLLLAVGLGLLSAGLAMAWPPGAFIAPGVILICVAIFGVRGAAAESE